MKSTPQFRSNFVEGDLPYQPFAGLTLDIGGQAETDPNLLALAGYLVRQVLADLHPERIARAADVEPLLVGLNAHVRFDKGEMTAVASDGPASGEPQLATGLVLDTFMLASNEARCVGVAELHQRLAPADRLDTLREALNDPANAGRYAVQETDDWNVFTLCLIAGFNPFVEHSDAEATKFEAAAKSAARAMGSRRVRNQWMAPRTKEP